MQRAGQTPHGARPNREGTRLRPGACRLGAPQPPGRSLEPRSNARPRGMAVPQQCGQNSAYRPSCHKLFFSITCKAKKLVARPVRRVCIGPSVLKTQNHPGLAILGTCLLPVLRVAVYVTLAQICHEIPSSTRLDDTQTAHHRETGPEFVRKVRQEDLACQSEQAHKRGGIGYDNHKPSRSSSAIFRQLLRSRFRRQITDVGSMYARRLLLRRFQLRGVTVESQHHRAILERSIV